MWPKRVAKKRVRLVPEMAFWLQFRFIEAAMALGNPFQRRFIAGNKETIRGGSDV
jgi:hypothetical protein